MNAEQTLFACLNNDSGVGALVNGRVVPLFVPQDGAFPCVVYQKISGPRVHSLKGQSGLARIRIQISCWALSFPEAKQVCEAVRLAIAKGIPGAEMNDGPDDYEPDTKRYRVDTDVFIWQKEDI